MSINTQKIFYEGPNVDNDTYYARLNTEKQKTMDDMVRYANYARLHVERYGMSPSWVAYCEKTNEIYKKANAGPINFEDLYSVTQAVGRIMYDSDIFSKLGIPTMVQQGNKTRWEEKDYLLKSFETPRFSKSFRSPVFINIGETSGWSNGIGLHLGISIPFTEIQESNGALWSPQSVMVSELGSVFGIQKNRRGYRGTTCTNALDDGGGDASTFGITGVANNANIQTFQAGAGADDNVASQGDIEYTIRAGLTKFKKVHHPGKYVFVSTSGFASEMFYHRDTYQQVLDWSRAKEILGIIQNLQSSNSWGGWWVDDELVKGAAADLTNAEQAFLIMKVSEANIKRLLVYPQQMKAMANKLYENDIQQNAIFGDIIQVPQKNTTYNAYPLAIAEAITSTDTGFIPNGMKIA